MKTIDISGMGGSYEASCQLMLLRGLKYLKEHPDFDFSVYKSFQNVYGICEGEGDKARELDEVISKGVEPSGAMHQAVISHLAYTQKHGHDAWIAEASNSSRVYEMPSEEELENQILIAHIEWQLKLDGGYNPLAELFKNIPLEDAIVVDVEEINMVADFNEWRAQYPDGTRILWHDYLDKKAWLPGSITGTRFWSGETVLLFRLDSDPPRERLPHMLAFTNRKLLKKQ